MMAVNVLLYVVVFAVLYNALDLLRLRWRVFAEESSSTSLSPTRERLLMLAAIVSPVAAAMAATALLFPMLDRAYEALAAFIGVAVAVGLPAAVLMAKVISAFRHYRKIDRSRFSR